MRSIADGRYETLGRLGAIVPFVPLQSSGRRAVVERQLEHVATRVAARSAHVDGGHVALGGWNPMKQTQEMLQKSGGLLKNWRIHTPICSPSRSETVSGRYFHNIKSPLPVPPMRNSTVPPSCEPRGSASRIRRQMNNELNFPPNFEGLVLGCIDADFCKQILV